MIWDMFVTTDLGRTVCSVTLVTDLDSGLLICIMPLAVFVWFVSAISVEVNGFPGAVVFCTSNVRYEVWLLTVPPVDEEAMSMGV